MESTRFKDEPGSLSPKCFPIQTRVGGCEPAQMNFMVGSSALLRLFPVGLFCSQCLRSLGLRWRSARVETNTLGNVGCEITWLRGSVQHWKSLQSEDGKDEMCVRRWSSAEGSTQHRGSFRCALQGVWEQDKGLGFFTLHQLLNPPCLIWNRTGKNKRGGGNCHTIGKNCHANLCCVKNLSLKQRCNKIPSQKSNSA